ncbi:primosomal protein N' [Halosquirtibacter laminarini]|uniref:Primosomal protein N n=1 Tax=Halosquirtibacter laminarini TaxID=3374600 RepID=A0AC61NQX7_9BACT|nr:primosomal protein N' [Prolixibacteraceae bacterium]
MSDSTFFVDVIVPLPLNATFTYHYDGGRNIVPGMRVVVPFRNKPMVAIVRNIHHDCPTDYKTKSIYDILDLVPSIQDSQLNFWSWIANYYQCCIGEVMKAAVPTSLRLDGDALISVSEEVEVETQNEWSDKYREIYYYALGDKALKLSKLIKEFGKKNVYSIVSDLVQQGVFSFDSLLTRNKQVVKMVRLAKEYQHERTLEIIMRGFRRSTIQLDILSLFYDNISRSGDSSISFSLSEIKAKYSYSAIQALIKKGVVEKYDQSIVLDENISSTTNNLPILSLDQERVYKEILSSFFTKQVALLHGVTASGKTEVYIRLIADCLKQRKQVLYLLPEIGLTTQIVRRLKSVFGNKVGLYHSRISDRQRMELWNEMLQYDPKVEDGPCQVILGARSSIFLPFKHLGLIIVDEEHETSFKQFDPSPRYNARDAAIVLAHIHQCKTLLGSATPSIESYHNALIGKYALSTLDKRFNDVALPDIVLADISESKRTKSMQGSLTPELYHEMKEALSNNKQIILFQNRRGYGLWVQCRDCQWTPKCLHCDVSLTHHKGDNALVCHYCGYKMYMPKICPTCSGSQIHDIGFGTEKIESEIAALFPQTKLLRLDLDTTKKKLAFDKIVREFENHEADILIGTQMVTKGLDFSNVAVVGIMNADALLNFPDFRAYERSFQLMLQVSGRAGRAKGGGKVVVQTSDVKNPLFMDVIHSDYVGLYRNQIRDREQFCYPPFYRMVSLFVKHKFQNYVDQFADQLAQILRQQFGNRVLGPEYPLLSRIQNQYQKQIILKFGPSDSVSTSKKRIQQIIQFLNQNSEIKGVTVVIDVDPM